MSGSGISWAICKSAPCSRQTTMPAPHHSVFTGRMPFLPPNQQRQSFEGKNTQRSKIYTVVKIAQGNCRTSHCRNCEKSTCSTDCLNRGNEEKSALAGSEFHTLAICSVKKFRCFEFSHGFIHLVWMPSWWCKSKIFINVKTYQSRNDFVAVK